MENTVIDKILSARDRRRTVISKMSQTSDVVSVKANVPGGNKNISHSVMLVSYFSRIIKNRQCRDIEMHGGFDGAWSAGRVQSGENFKKASVSIEENHPLGRFIDIDVTLCGEEKSLSRASMRKCFLCDNPAFVCGRAGTHSAEELLNCFTGSTEKYFENLISYIVFESMMAELNLENKFGLVSPTSNGSHKDLSYNIMKRAAEAVSKPLSECFLRGLRSETPEGMLKYLRPIGLSTEERMLDETCGANAYKGFIFVGGVLLGAVGYAVGRGLEFSDVYRAASEICRDINDEPPCNTFGYFAFKELNFGGIRKHAKNGFDVVKLAEERLDNDLSQDSLLSVLTAIVGKIDDSVLLKRAKSIERYLYFKEKISTLRLSDSDELLKLNRLCEEENISIGGSADVLIAAVMMRKLRELFLWK